MRIYVDELPESCAECEWFTPNHSSKDGRNFCLLARMPFYNTEEERQTTRGQHKDSLSDFECPLQSLSDYTKQVRKEVCDNFRKIAMQYYTTDDEGNLILTCNDVWDILSKLQGEDK